MRGRAARTLVLVAAALAVAVGLVALGRVTAGTGGARADGERRGRAAGYADGVRDGRAAGLQEGRALQVPLALPPGTQDAARAAFAAGYTAGANDAFDGYDGGWGLDEPYVVVLGPGGDGVTYRIRSRTPVRDGVDYYLCPHSTSLCQQPR